MANKRYMWCISLDIKQYHYNVDFLLVITISLILSQDHLHYEIYEEGKSVVLHFLVDLESFYSFNKMSPQKAN
jgi:hypothetical protein